MQVLTTAGVHCQECGCTNAHAADCAVLEQENRAAVHSRSNTNWPLCGWRNGGSHNGIKMGAYKDEGAVDCPSCLARLAEPPHWMQDD